MNILQHAAENKAMYATAALVITLLGGSVVVELPADKKIKALETQFAQNWQDQQQYHASRELQQVRWRMDYVKNEINRMLTLPKYLQRPLSPEEVWVLDQLKQEWEFLREREQQLSRY